MKPPAQRGDERMATETGNYRSHAGRELDLMLAGEKPLAMFYMEILRTMSG